MAIEIKVVLDNREIDKGAKEIAGKVSSALNTVVKPAQDAGRKMGNALSGGIAQAVRLVEQHERRMEAIHAQSAERIKQIEARKQAQLEVIRERAMQREIERQHKLERAAQSSTGGFAAFMRRSSATIREAGESLQAAGFAALGLTAAIVSVGRASFQAAVQIDQQVNVLRALTGSAEAAEKRFSDLVALAQQTPGLTSSLALALDTQLRVLNVSEQTINRLLPAIGRLNAVSPLGDPQRFTQNLVQLVTQNFEKQDLKELVGASPLAGELIKTIFNVESPTNAKAIRAAAQRLGITTVEGFANAFAEAAANNPKLKAIQESLATQFEKLRDRVIIALRPIGLSLVETLQPLVETAVPIIERVARGFASLPEPVRAAIVVMAGLAAALGPVLIAVGAVVQSLGALGSVITAIAGAGGVSALIASMGPFIPVILAVAEAVGVLVAAFVTDFGGIRTVVFDVIDFIARQFAVVKQAFHENRAEIELLKTQFQVFSQEVRPIVVTLGEVFKNVFELAIKGAITVASAALTFFNTQLALTIDAFRKVKNVLGEIADVGVKAANFLTPGLNLGDRIKSGVGATFQGRASSTLPPSGGGIDIGEELNFLVEQNRKLMELDPRFKRGGGGGGGGDDKKKKKADEVAKEIERLKKAIRDENAKFMEDMIKDFDDLAKEITKQNLDFEKKQKADADFRAKRLIEQRQSRRELTQKFNEQEIAGIERGARREFNRSGRLLDDAISRGQLTAEEAELINRGAALKLASDLQKVLERREELGDITDQAKEDLKEEISLYQKLGTSITNTESFLRGFNSQIESTSTIFDRFGQNVAKAFTNIKDLFSGLKAAVVDFFNSLLAQSLQNVMRQVLGGLFGSLGGLMGAFGVAAGVGRFRTPSTFPGGSALQSLVSAFGGGGGGISIPGSISFPGLPILGRAGAQGTTGIFANGQFAAGLRGDFVGGTVPRTAGVIRPTFGSALSGIGKSLAAAAPFLGFSFGSGVGGQSIGGQLLGGIGGALGGLVLGASTGAIGGSLGSLFALSGALGPIALAAAPLLLVGGFLLGKAKQRKADEEASGQMLTAAIQQIEQLASAIGSDQVEGSQARAIFEGQILATFKSGIMSLKTESVRKSRLTNQVRDLEGVFQAVVVPQIEAQAARRQAEIDAQKRAQEEAKRAQEEADRLARIHARLIPQFARGGVVPGRNIGRDSVLSALTPGEMVLTQSHQAAIRAMAGHDAFQRAGVPGAQQSAAFQNGGIVPLSSGQGEIVIDNLNITIGVGVSDQEAQVIVARGMRGETGRRIVVNHITEHRLYRGSF